MVSAGNHAGGHMVEKRDWLQMLASLGWSKAELADRLGVHRSTVSGWGDGCPRYAERFLAAHAVMAEAGEMLLGAVQMAPHGRRGRGDTEAQRVWREGRQAVLRGAPVGEDDRYPERGERWEDVDG